MSTLLATVATSAPYRWRLDTVPVARSPLETDEPRTATPEYPADAPWTGAVSADDIDKVYPDEVTRDYGALPPETMRRVDDALRVALAL
ncbi:hypothetical protein [Parasphingorhabdus pacifica]